MAADGAAAKIAAYLAQLNPVPAFPEYTGPYKVGTVDVEIPVADLASASPAPAHAGALHTVLFRVFYPAAPDAQGKRISWLPTPQRAHVSAYTQFLGIAPLVAEVVSFLPRHLHYTTIPALKNAALLAPDAAAGLPGGRWPTMVFSHGLGGSRNAYSHVAGSVASHGVVVVCPEHRDGSAVLSLVRDPAAQDRFFPQSRRRVVPYDRIPHDETPAVWAARDQQLRVRLWELGLVYDALVRLDEADAGLRNLNGSTPAAATAQFAGRLRIHSPGDVVWSGHSFGAASIAQFLKTVYYADTPAVAAIENPLYTPGAAGAGAGADAGAAARLRAQIAAQSPTILLDMWCFPLLSPAQRALHDLPLPVYAADVAAAPGGAALLAVESESFYEWTRHLHTTARMLSPDPAAAEVTAAAFARQPSGVRLPEPNVFYVAGSAHLSQSDFGLLFPWVTKRVFGAVHPERAIRLNLRAILQLLRANGVPVARTWVGDLVDGADVDKLEVAAAAAETAGDEEGRRPHTVGDRGPADGIHDDRAIFDRSGRGAVACWHWIDVVGMGVDPAGGAAEAKMAKTASTETTDTQTTSAVEAGRGQEQAMESEIEPHLGAATGGRKETRSVSAAA